jgi:hypothetical protein
MSRLLTRGASFTATGLTASWILQSDRSPLYDWLLYHLAAGNVAAILNFPAFIAAALGSGNIHDPSDAWYYSALVVQWLLYGFAVAWISCKLWPNNSFKPKPLRGSA